MADVTETIVENKPYGGDKLFAKMMADSFPGNGDDVTTSEEDLKLETEQKAVRENEAIALQDTEKLNKLILEKTGGKFASIDEVVAAQAAVAPEIKFENDSSKQVYELLVAGKIDDVYDVLKKQKTDYASLKDIDVIKLDLKKDNSYLTDTELDELIVDKYGLDEEITEDDKTDLTASQLREKEARIAKNQRSVKRDASSVRVKMESSKTDIKMPELPKQEMVPGKNEDDKLVEMWITETESGAKALPDVIDYSLSVDVTDGDSRVSYTRPFKIEGDDKKALDSAIRSFLPPIGHEGEYIKDGKVDVGKIQEEVSDRLFGKRVFALLLKDSIAKAKQSVISGIKDITETPTGTIPAQSMDIDEWLHTKAMHT